MGVLQFVTWLTECKQVFAGNNHGIGIELNRKFTLKNKGLFNNVSSNKTVTLRYGIDRYK